MIPFIFMKIIRQKIFDKTKIKCIISRIHERGKNMSYSALKKFLSKNYQRIHGKIKDYYLDQEGKVVATIEKKEDGTKLITTYINDERGELDSHYDKVVLSVCNKIDQLMVDVLLGSNNDAKIIDGQIYFCDNPELEKLTKKYNSDSLPQYNLGTIGTIQITNAKAILLLGEDKSIEEIKTIPSKNGGPTHLSSTSKTKMIRKCFKR